ncbi:hypothetical protein [Acinetobacter ursingii]|uniref:hypothetical protein n=1 Tax=Acinetobacter ursingii TaxID=108980 RepID=UPI001D18DE64|nr:hypothetical protein [Acinetobacter ursingii]
MNIKPSWDTTGDLLEVVDPTAEQIISACLKLSPEDAKHLQHDIIQRFGSPLQPIYVDESSVEVKSFFYWLNGQDNHADSTIMEIVTIE